jgi:hypothetical protein
MKYLEWNAETSNGKAASDAIGAFPASNFARYPIRDDDHEDMMWSWLFNVFCINAYIVHD